LRAICLRLWKRPNVACLSLMERTDDYRELFGKKCGIARECHDKESAKSTDLGHIYDLNKSDVSSL
jgi:hypothetical protein